MVGFDLLPFLNQPELFEFLGGAFFYFAATLLFGIYILYFSVYFLDSKHIENLLKTPVGNSRAFNVFINSLTWAIIIEYSLIASRIDAKIIIYAVFVTAFIIALTRLLYYINNEKGMEFFKMIMEFVVGIFLLAPIIDITTLPLTEFIRVIIAISFVIYFFYESKAKIKIYYIKFETDFMNAGQEEIKIQND
ncbi:MAG: hypothetical protein ACXADW_21440 [Candidatus Hodarchaeales archaeon]|jgi:hypothetical protein